MKPFPLLLSAIGMFSLPAVAGAQDAGFALTYHVERIPAAQFSIDTCGSVVSDAAQQAGLSVDLKSFPDQLVTVHGGASGTGAYVVQCIAVGDTTVAVVQGFDYRETKGTMGEFADQAIAAVKEAAK